MAVSLADIDKWNPWAIHEVADAMAGRGSSAEQVMTGLTILPIVASWTGQASDSARVSLDRLSSQLGGHSEQMQTAAAACGKLADDVENLKAIVAAIDRDASAEGFTVNRTTGEVTRTDPDRLATSAAYQQEMADLQRRITAALAQANALDEDLTRALSLELPQGTPDPAAPSPDPALPPPRTPPANDDPWQHGGDRRWTSVATEGLKQKAVAAAELEMLRNNQTNAAAFLDHYLDNSGAPKALPADVVDRWLSDSANGYNDLAATPAAQVTTNLQSITRDALAQARSTGKPVTLSGTTPWAVVAGSDGDEVRTLGHYSLSTAYTITMNPDGTYTANYRNDVMDWYNFATTSPMPSDLSHNVSNMAHDLQAVGIAQDFLVTGSGSVQRVQGRMP